MGNPSVVSIEMPTCPKCGRTPWRLDVLGPGTAVLPCGHVVPPDTVEGSDRPELREVNA